MTQKPEWLERVKEKISTLIGENLVYKATLYFDMVKSFVLDQIKIDEGDEEKYQKLKKFIILTIVVGIIAFIYGKKVFGDKVVIEEGEETDRNEKFENFIEQLTSIMQKLLPTAYVGIATFLVTKNIIKEQAISDEEHS